MRRISVLALVLFVFAGCGEVDLGSGRDAGSAGNAGTSGAAAGGSVGVGGATTGGSGGAGLGGATTGGSGGSAGLLDASDGAVSHDAGWFSCNGSGTACACDGTTHYCYKFVGGASGPPPPPDAAVCDQDGGLGCTPLPTGCGPSCDCVMKFVTYPNCKCVDSSGNVEVDCMGICASPDTPIDTPDGPRAIAELRPGDLVYSVDKGHLAAVPIRRVHRIAVRAHSVIHVELANGSTLEISAPHPTADGRSFGDLAAGDELDGVRILRVRRIPYAFDATYDILPASDTGSYFAGGVLIGSTMAPPPAVLESVALR